MSETFEITSFLLASDVEFLGDDPDSWAQRVRVQNKITRTSSGPEAPEVMEAFDHPGLVLVTRIQSRTALGTHVVRYRCEDPRGASRPLRQARPSEWPEWALSRGSAELVREAGARDRERLIGDLDVPLRPGEKWLGVHPLALRFERPGVHTFRLYFNNRRAATFELVVEYRRLPFGEPVV